jgi:1-acyl-sn-glycerol-3-phosphate acyltransferase
MPTTPGRLHYYYGLEQIRCLASWIVTVAATVIFGTIGIAVSFADFTGNVTHACARYWARTFLWIHGVNLTVQGLEHLDPEHSYVFVANHNSALDIPALLVALPLRFRMVAKASLFRIPFLGWYMRRVGYVPVPWNGGSTDLEAAARRLRGGSSVLVFPEGTRTDESELARFRKGGFYLARGAGIPLVPVAVINTGRLLPRGKIWVNLGVVEVRVGEPISATGDESLAKLAARCRQRVAELPL